MRQLARGLSRFPFKEEIAGSNPACLTKVWTIGPRARRNPASRPSDGNLAGTGPSLKLAEHLSFKQDYERSIRSGPTSILEDAEP